MKRLYILFVVSLFISASAAAQVYGNEWIVYSQQYLKIKVANDGIYRIDSTVLSNAINAAGASLSTVDARNFQLFHNGQEEYIWIKGEADGVINATDYIEFYGVHNDGAKDSALYMNGNTILNPLYSIYSDTAVYYLTWNTSNSNLRFTSTADTAFSAYTPAPYFTNRETFIGNSAYFPGVQNSLGLTDPAFISSEGFYDLPFDYATSASRNVYSANAYTAPGRPDARVQIKIGSHSDDANNLLDNKIQILFPSVLFDTMYDGYQVNTYNFNSIDPATLGSGYTTFVVSSINASASISSGRTAIAYITLDYPHTFGMEGRTRFFGHLPDNTSASKSYLVLTGVGGSGPVRVYDFFNHERIDATSVGPVHHALVANGNGTEKPFAIVDELSVRNVTTIVPVTATGFFTDFGFTPVDSAFVIVAHKSLMNVAQQYKTYRSSMAGGTRNVVLADVGELYDQFAYGVSQHPLSIRNFSAFLIATYPSTPAHLFLIGKSIYADYSRSHQFAPNLVPTFGYPPCDNGLTAGLNGTLWEAAIPTGRIAALDSAQAQWYLNKVISYESQPPAEWMKHVLHFGGGSTSVEQSQFSGFLNNYENIIEDTLFGGTVQTYLKTSTSPIQINQSDSLRDRIEAGVSIMTFFGHASGTGFDQSIDDPSTYSNIDRYPFLLANSCYAGDIHSPGVSSSEAFTLIDQKGTIGYLASVGLGFPGFLNLYSTNIYRSVGQTLYGKSIGECIQWSVNQAENTYPQDIFLKTTLMEMTLQGDPSVVINSFPKPDYQITNADVWFDQQTQPDSISVFAKVTNLGKAVSDTFIVQLVRNFPNGSGDTLYQQIRAPKFRDTLLFRIPVDQQRGIGLNRIRISIDHYQEIDEMNENNNVTIPDIDLLIHGSAIVPVYPYEFAVIPNDTITLKASTVNPLEPLKTYRFELDTTDLFNSAFKQTYVITTVGGVVNWQPNLLSTDSMVYFWRVSPDSLTTADAFLWRKSSFQYITNRVGWGQDHIFQFSNDNYQYVQLDRTQRDFDFVNDVRTISVKNGIYGATIPWNEVYYKLDGGIQHIFSCVFGCGSGGVTIAVIDPVTGMPWSYLDTNAVGPAGNCICYPQTFYAYDFADNTVAGRSNIENFMASIPLGFHVLVYSQYYHNASSYPAGLLTQFDSIGSPAMGSVADTTAFIVWGTKGALTSGTTVVGANSASVITLQDTIVTNWNVGQITSPVIGPAASWGSFHWKQRSVESPDNDSVSVVLYGITANGVQDSLTTFVEDSTDINSLLPYVNASAYPYIRLAVRMKDDTSRTPVQMERWHVLYSPMPDVAVNPPLTFSFYNDSLQEGENAKLVVAIQNLTPWSLTDSLLLTYWLIDKNRVRHNLPQKLRAPSFNGFQWFVDTVNVNTVNYTGTNELWLEVNPVGNVNSQLEQYHFNNVVMVPFTVGIDRINPLLDVTFDGVHIMDKDLVSGKPGILITLKDENQFLALNDTSDFNVFLRSPSQTVAQLVPWSADMQFIPAVLPHNSCKILFNPNCAEDGIYELIVQAKDRSNNVSGLIDYEISFEVINHATITNVLNYPNPFSSSTQFVFTLTGNEVPDLFTIQVMTITGKVVREINREEFADLHIGRNITSYAWDGRDEYGDQLANGIYLYRIITRIDGESIEQRNSGADQYINHGWGKMYLMR
ncbi:MAG: C25 family cysteine peptidase [Bacteroidota bacterium]|nr:C25 family cysteine peptidase [Bacteroidota bacterium]